MITPSPSQSLVDVTANVMDAVVNEQSFNGLVPSTTSSPLLTPSPSQSAAFHAAVGAILALANTKLHGLFGSVPSVISSALITPSPSESNASMVMITIVVSHRDPSQLMIHNVSIPIKPLVGV